MGSILSRVDKHNPWHDDCDATFAGGVKAAALGKSTGAGVSTTKSTEALASTTGRLGVIQLSRRNVEGGGADRGVVEDKSINSFKAPIAALPSESHQEKRKALALIRYLPATSKSRFSDRVESYTTLVRTTQRGSTMKSAESRSNASEIDAPFATCADKENDAPKLTTNAADVDGTSRHFCGRQHVRMPLSPIEERHDHVRLQRKDLTGEIPCAAGKMKKLRPVATNNSRVKVDLNAASPIKVEIQTTKDAMKVPVDPPGSILGARPMIHYSNVHHPLVPYAEHGPGCAVGGFLVSGGVDHRSFQPEFLPMTNWGFYPSQYHHHTHQLRQQQQEQQQQEQQLMQQQQQQQKQQQQQQYEKSHNSYHNCHPREVASVRSQQWTMPHFIAPLVATVRHPFSNFMSGGNGVHGNSWTSSGEEHKFGHMVHNASNSQNSSVENYDQTDGVPTSESDEDIMSADESMDSLEEVTQDIKEVVTKFIPSTFAPQECVEIIKARNEASAKLISLQPRQTRSITSMTSVQQRRDVGLRSSFPTDLSKLKTKCPIAVATVAHQACSPRVSISRGKTSGVKVVPVNAAIQGNDSSELIVRTILGRRVTMVDEARKVFVIDLLSPEVCDQIRMMADDHTREIHKSGSSAENWRTLYTYTKMDLPAVEVKDMVIKYTDQILHDVKKIVGELYGGNMRREAMNLRPRSWKEPHLLLYQRLDGRPDHTGIEMHYDGCDITWQAMLTRLDEYEGGGTYFRSLRKTILLRQGQVLVHPGELYHMGIDITYGVRCLLVCFTDGANPKILDDSKSDEDDPSFRNNTVLC